MAGRMTRFGTLGLVRFGAGEMLALTPDQAAPRAAMLEAAGKGLWRVTGNVELKAGETVGLKVDGPLPRYLDGLLQPLKGGKAVKPGQGGDDSAEEPSFPPGILAAIRRTAEKQEIAEGDLPSLAGVNASLALDGIERLMTQADLVLAWAEIRAADANDEGGGDGGGE